MAWGRHWTEVGLTDHWTMQLQQLDKICPDHTVYAPSSCIQHHCGWGWWLWWQRRFITWQGMTWWTIGMIMLANIFTIYIYFSHTLAGVIITSFTLPHLPSNPLQPCPIVYTSLWIITRILTLICQWFLWPYCCWNMLPLLKHSLIVALV